MNDTRHKAKLVLTGHIIDSMILPEKARVGQAPPAGPPPASQSHHSPSYAGGGPAKPGHAKART